MGHIIFLAIALIASFASAVFGFGSALLVLAFGSLVLPVKDTIVLATVLFTASTFTKTWLFRDHVDWKIAGVMSVACLPFAVLGAYLLVIAPANIVKPILGVMVLVYVGLTATKSFPSIEIGFKGLLAGSALYGFTSGFLGSGNVIKVMLFREMKISKEAFVGVMAATAVFSNIAKLISYSQSGLFKADMTWTALGLVFIAIVVALTGRYLLRKMSNDVFQNGVHILLVVAAIALFL